MTERKIRPDELDNLKEEVAAEARANCPDATVQVKALHGENDKVTVFPTATARRTYPRFPSEA